MRLALRDIKTPLIHPMRFFRALRDPRTPFFARLLPLVALIYVLFPIDFMPDFIPLIGQIDDLTIVMGFIYYAFKLIPNDVYREHFKAVRHN